jgi:anti-sigma-K factor RskA
MRRQSDLHTLAGAYAMDAVPAPDRAAFERHLAGCEPCRQEVRGLREAAAALAAATAVQPTAAFREAALRAAAQTRQIPPPAAAPAPSWRALRPRGRGVRDLGGLRGIRGWRPRLGVALAGAVACVLAVVAVVAGISAYGMHSRLSQDQGHDHAVAMVLGAPDAKMMSAPVSTGGTATVVMSHRERALVFTVADLRVLPPSESYELWLMGPAGNKPAGMISVSVDGKMASPMVVSGLSSGESVGMTVEPAGGSPHPTTPPVVVIALTGT